jgi:hypothetical protein
MGFLKESHTMIIRIRRNRLVLALAGVGVFLAASAVPSSTVAAPFPMVCRFCAPGTPPTCEYTMSAGAQGCKFYTNELGQYVCEEVGTCPSPP